MSWTSGIQSVLPRIQPLLQLLFATHAFLTSHPTVCTQYVGVGPRSRLPCRLLDFSRLSDISPPLEGLNRWKAPCPDSMRYSLTESRRLAWWLFRPTPPTHWHHVLCPTISPVDAERSLVKPLLKPHEKHSQPRVSNGWTIKCLLAPNSALRFRLM